MKTPQGILFLLTSVWHPILCDAFSAENRQTLVVVGGGVGGLASAARIASSPDLPPSTQVILLEKNSREMAGGRCGSFFRNVKGLGSFRHERGPSLLLLKDVYLDLFRDCGKSAQDYELEIRQCAPAYQVVFEDGESILLGFPRSSDLVDQDLKGLEEKSRTQMNGFETDGAAKWDAYMQSTQAFLDCGLPNFIEERLDLVSFPSFVIEACKDGFKVSTYSSLCLCLIWQRLEEALIPSRLLIVMATETPFDSTRCHVCFR